MTCKILYKVMVVFCGMGAIGILIAMAQSIGSAQGPPPEEYVDEPVGTCVDPANKGPGECIPRDEPCVELQGGACQNIEEAVCFTPGGTVSAPWVRVLEPVVQGGECSEDGTDTDPDCYDCGAFVCARGELYPDPTDCQHRMNITCITSKADDYRTCDPENPEQN